MKVFKFGGSSLATPEGFKKCAQLLTKNKDTITVLSAIGKINNQDKKATDLLYDICLKKKCNKSYKNEIILLKKKFFLLSKRLKTSQLFYSMFNEFLKAIPALDDNYIISRGEFFTAFLMREYTGIEFIDSRLFFKFKSSNRINEKKSYDCFCNIAKNKFITCGFYGEYENGKIALFKRGGGDISGAYIAAFSKAKAYYNFTDVNGMYNNPPYFFNKQTINRINYSDTLYLTQNGANVLCDAALPVLFRFRIPTYIINSTNPKAKKTLICNCEKSIKSTCSAQEKNCFITIIPIPKKSQKSRLVYSILKRVMSNKIKVLYINVEKNAIAIISNNPLRLENLFEKNITKTQNLIYKTTFLFSIPNKSIGKIKNIKHLSSHTDIYLRLSNSGKKLDVFSYEASESFFQKILDILQ